MKPNKFFLGPPLALLPLQLLWINPADTLLGLSLAFKPKEGDVMNRPPRDPKRPLLTFPLIMHIWLRIVGVAAMAFAAVEFEKWICFGRHHDNNTMPV